MQMDRPQIYLFLLPLTIVTLLLYLKMLYVLWRKSGYDSLFYKLIRTQALFDISYVIVFFAFETPQDWESLNSYALSLNNTYWIQLMYAHAYFCVNGQILGVTLNSIGRVLMVRFPTKSITKSIDQMSMLTIALIHFTPPFIFGMYIFYGQTPSHIEFIPSLDRVTRVTETIDVRINSIVSMITSISGAIFSSVCYILIFLTLKKRAYRCWNTEASILSTSFVLFLCLCSIAGYYLGNGTFSILNKTAMFTLRLHYYAFSFPISLLNPWCLLLTSEKMRKDVLGFSCSQTAIRRILPSRTPPTQGTSGPNGASSSSNK